VRYVAGSEEGLMVRIHDPYFIWLILFVTSCCYSMACGQSAEWATLIQ